MPEDIKCRACGSKIVHTDDYETPTPACISYLHARMELLNKKLDAYDEYIKKLREIFA